MILNKTKYNKFQNEELIISQQNNSYNTNISNTNIKSNLLNYKNIGNNIICCNKYVFGTKDNLGLFILILFGIILTYIGWIISNNYFYPIYFYFIGTILFLLTIIFFLLSFFTEPGIIPRFHPDFQEKEEKDEKIIINNLGNDNKVNYAVDKSISSNDNILFTIINKENKQNQIPTIYTERVCKTCNIIRPPLSSHCRICDNCVQDYDHHCFFISNCVGKRNHKYFYLFLSFGSLLSIYVLIFDFILILYIFIINPKGIWKIIYLNDRALLFISLILISISAIYLLLGCKNVYILFFSFIYFIKINLIILKNIEIL